MGERKQASVKAKQKDHPDPWGEATAEATVDEALRLMKPTAHVTPEVLALLATELPGISGSVSEVAAMSPLRLAAKLIGMPSVAEDDLFDIAKDLIAGFRVMLGTQPEPEAKPQPEPEKPKAAPHPEQRTRQTAPRTEEEYRNLLRAASTGGEDTMSGTVRPGRTVIDCFSTMSGSVHLEETIVLGDSSTMSGSITGTAYVPRGVRFSTMSGSKRATVHARSYEDLARLAGLA